MKYSFDIFQLFKNVKGISSLGAAWKQAAGQIGHRPWFANSRIQVLGGDEALCQQLILE